MTTGLWELVGAVVAFVLSAVIGKFLIPILHKLKYGQTILDIGPSWHKKKQGTPTMGGDYVSWWGYRPVSWIVSFYPCK